MPRPRHEVALYHTSYTSNGTAITSNFRPAADGAGNVVWSDAGFSYASNANSVASASTGGAATTVSRGDHVHVGVRSVSHTSNTFSGPVTFTTEGDLAITSPAAGTFAFKATTGAGGGGSGESDLSGEELDYAEQTSSVTVSATTEATANTVVSGNAVVYDGSTEIEIEFGGGAARPGFDIAGRSLAFWLYDGSSSIGRLGIMFGAAAAADVDPVHLSRKLTPSGASHTYSVRASVSASTGSLTGGIGGVGEQFPIWIRITRV